VLITRLGREASGRTSNYIHRAENGSETNTPPVDPAFSRGCAQGGFRGSA